VLTAHEKLTAPGVVIHLPRAVVLTHAKAGVRSGLAHDPREARPQSLLQTPLPPKPGSAPHDSSHLADPIPTKAIWRPFKSHK
jgi:hypothetical protein